MCPGERRKWKVKNSTRRVPQGWRLEKIRPEKGGGLSGKGSGLGTNKVFVQGKECDHFLRGGGTHSGRF